MNHFKHLILFDKRKFHIFILSLFKFALQLCDCIFFVDFFLLCSASPIAFCSTKAHSKVVELIAAIKYIDLESQPGLIAGTLSLLSTIYVTS